VLDQTAEDILERDPRFLTRSKNFPTFFAFGPELMTIDEALVDGSLDHLRVATVINGVVHRQAPVEDMTFDPAGLVAFHSDVMPLFPGDILSTGTPGAVALAAGDVVEARIDGLAALRMRVLSEHVRVPTVAHRTSPTALEA
jgi:2-keto-4-pentenoate hydratase/2-oxohepta-3-ene-1,7-dioic acid hydratase in catechol pathway